MIGFDLNDINRSANLCQADHIVLSENTHITGRQIAAARALAGLGQGDLAAKSNVSIATLRRMEAATGPATGMINNVSAVQAVLEDAGIIFLDPGAHADGGPGVRLRKAEA